MSHATESIVLHSRNPLHPENTNSYFTARLPRALTFKSPQEIGLLEVSMPNTFFIILQGTHLTIALYHNKTEDTSDIKIKSLDNYAPASNLINPHVRLKRSNKRAKKNPPNLHG